MFERIALQKAFIQSLPDEILKTCIMLIRVWTGLPAASKKSSKTATQSHTTWLLV
jgi:hypothetical protein